MATSSVTTDITNYTRIYLILVKGGTLLTKTLFIKRANYLSLPHPPGLNPQQVVDRFLRDIDISDAISSTTTGRNYNYKIYPSTGTTNLEEFDLYLFCFILIKVCNLPDINKEDIETLKEIRNYLSHCHAPTLCQDDFNYYLQLIKEVFERTLEYINNPSFTDEMNLLVKKCEEGPLAIDEIVIFYHEVNLKSQAILDNLTKMEKKQDVVIQNQNDMRRDHKVMLQNDNMVLQNSNTLSAKVDELLEKVTNIQSRLSPGTPVEIPEIEAILEVENLTSDRQEELLEHLETEFNRAISNPNETLLTVEKETVSKSVYETVRTLLSKGWNLLKVRRKCLLLTFKSRSISSFVSLIRGCIDGSLQNDLLGLEEAVKGWEGYADVKFTIIVTQDKIIEAIYTLVKNLDDKVPHEMPIDSPTVHKEQSVAILKSSLNCTTEPTNADLSTAPHLILIFKPTVVRQTEIEDCVNIEHVERELKQIQNEIRNEPDFASVEITAKILKLDGERKEFDKTQDSELTRTKKQESSRQSLQEEESPTTDTSARKDLRHTIECMTTLPSLKSKQPCNTEDKSSYNDAHDADFGLLLHGKEEYGYDKGQELQTYKDRGKANDNNVAAPVTVWSKEDFGSKDIKPIKSAKEYQKEMKKVKVYSVCAVGMPHYGDQSLTVGEEYYGIRETYNPHDSNAVAVYSDKKSTYSAHLERSHAAIVSEISPFIEGPILIKPKFEPVLKKGFGPEQRCNLCFYCQSSNVSQVEDILKKHKFEFKII